jgi:hypothetical protein
MDISTVKHWVPQITACALALLGLNTGAICRAQQPPALKGEAKPYRVPYIVADSSHPIVRVKINGEGPFNLLLDSGAPAVFLNTNVVDAVKPKRAPAQGWAILDTLEIEGGPTMEKMDARIENTRVVTVLLNGRRMCGIRVDGILGYPVMARFKIELDVRKPYMIWTPLDFHPPVARNSNPKPQVVTVEPPSLPAIYAVPRANSLLGDLRNHPPPPLPGYIGVELDGVAIAAIAKGSPAEKAGLKVGDIVAEIGMQPIRSADDIRRVSPTIVSGKTVEIKVRRGGQTIAVTATPVTAF